MPEPIITCVIPTYQRPHLLPRAIQSVLAQTYPRIRILVCDNASGDETAGIVAEFHRRDRRVMYHCQSTNLGWAPNFRFAIDAVETEYFSILSDDDVLLPGFYRHAIDAFERHPEARLFCGQVVVYDANRGTHGLRPHRDWEQGLHEAGRSVARMFDNQFYWTSCVLSSAIREKVTMHPMPMTDVLYLAQTAAWYPFVVKFAPCAIWVATGENTFLKTSGDDLLWCRRVLYDACEDLPGVTDSERQEIRTILREKMRIIANGLLRTALEAGDRDRFDDMARFLREHGGQSWRRRLRTAITAGGPGRIPFQFMRGVTRVIADHKRMRRSRYKKLSWDEVVAHYGGQQSERIGRST